ncbi:hypothetical protein [Luteitalea sp.]|uniref:hypothetical protein n=1 Tax=Luteitalea sp. TaxID=2004800 RepID=UPI0025C1559B|nr:hypothetical protein [Luteitalea sp.]
MRVDGEVLDAGMGRQEDRDGGPEATAAALLIEQERDGPALGASCVRASSTAAARAGAP